MEKSKKPENQKINAKQAISNHSIKQTFAIEKSLYLKACIVAKKRGLKVTDLLRILLSNEVSKELLS